MCFRWEKNKGAEKGFGLEDFKMAGLSKVNFYTLITRLQNYFLLGFYFVFLLGFSIVDTTPHKVQMHAVNKLWSVWSNMICGQ